MYGIQHARHAGNVGHAKLPLSQLLDRVGARVGLGRRPVIVGEV